MTEMRHQNKLQKTRMLIDAVDQYIYNMKKVNANQVAIEVYTELLNELEEEEAQLERTIERKS